MGAQSRRAWRESQFRRSSGERSGPATGRFDAKDRSRSEIFAIFRERRVLAIREPRIAFYRQEDRGGTKGITEQDQARRSQRRNLKNPNQERGSRRS